MSTPLLPAVVFVDCPRCAARGRSHWVPDHGICYLCRGQGEIKVDVARSGRHLAYLRGEFTRVRDQLRATRNPEEKALLREVLGGLVIKGQQRRQLHEMALVAQKEAA